LASTIITQLREAEKNEPGTWRIKWRSMMGNDHPDPLNEAENLDQAVALIEKFMPLYDEQAELLRLPAKEYDAKYPEFVKRAEATWPVAKLLLPAMHKVVMADRRIDARMSMLIAGIAVVESGPKKLADIKDPFGDGPFKYKKLDEGFELSSNLQEEGKPVTLAIGVKKKASAK